MAAFQIKVGGEIYDMEFNRDGAVRFEQMGGTLENLRTQIHLTTNRLFVIGIMTPAKNLMNENLALKILDKALEEYGVGEVYATLVEPFVEVFTQAGKETGKKSMLVQPLATQAE